MTYMLRESHYACVGDTIDGKTPSAVVGRIVIIPRGTLCFDTGVREDSPACAFVRVKGGYMWVKANKLQETK